MLGNNGGQRKYLTIHFALLGVVKENKRKRTGIVAILKANSLGMTYTVLYNDPLFLLTYTRRMFVEQKLRDLEDEHAWVHDRFEEMNL